MIAPKQILVVEDDLTTLEAMAGYFEVEGYRALRARDSEEMDRELRRHVVDLIVLDIRLPGKDGLTILRELRAESEVPVIVVSARTEDVDHIVALEIGADDYLNKPINMRELLARTKISLRRTDRLKQPIVAERSRLQIGEWTLDRNVRKLSSDAGGDMPLTRAEFDLLEFMALRPGRVLQREQLLECLSSREWQPYDRSIDVLIGRLRRKIEQDPKLPSLILTVRGVGYVLMEPMRH